MGTANVGNPFQKFAVKIRKVGREEDQGRTFQIKTLSNPQMITQTFIPTSNVRKDVLLPCNPINRNFWIIIKL